MSAVDLGRLLRDPPLIHEGGAVTWGLDARVLDYLDATVTSSHVTLETGIGLSTIVFAMRGSRHHVIVPAKDEGARIVSFCREAGISIDAVTFHFGHSESVLPALDTPPLDLVLIDGCHGFPSPFIDWYYTASRLKVGGYLIVDDVHIWPCRMLARFLRAEDGWERLRRVAPRTELFRKIKPFEPSVEWAHQKFVARRSRATIAWYRLVIGLELMRKGEWSEVFRKLRGSIRQPAG